MLFYYLIATLSMYIKFYVSCFVSTANLQWIFASMFALIRQADQSMWYHWLINDNLFVLSLILQSSYTSTLYDQLNNYLMLRYCHFFQVTAEDESGIHIWDLRMPKIPIQDLPGHTHWYSQISVVTPLLILPVLCCVILNSCMS